MPKPSTPAVWASGKTFGFQPSQSQQAQGFDYIATVRPGTGAPITDDHDWPLNNITTSLKWVMDQLPNGGIQELLTALLPKRSFSANDFIRIPDVPGGLIIQFGGGSVSATTANQALTITYPTTFPNACLANVLTHSGNGIASAGNSRGYIMSCEVGTNTSFQSSYSASSSVSIFYKWIAVGY